MTTKVMAGVPCERCKGLATTTVTTRHFGLEKLCDGCAVNIRRDGQEVVVTTYSDAIQQAFRDWNEHRAYVDNGGNYRVRPEAATPTHRPRGGIAPWNKEVKRLFPGCAEFHAAAQEAAQEGLKPGLLTDEEAQLVVGAIPLQALPAADTGEDWVVFKYQRRLVLDAFGCLVAEAQTEEQAAQIVSDHNAVRKLVAALRSRVSPTRCYCNVMAGNTCADCEHRALLATLATVSDAAKEQINR